MTDWIDRRCTQTKSNLKCCIYSNNCNNNCFNLNIKEQHDLMALISSYKFTALIFDAPFTKFSKYKMGMKITFMPCIVVVNKLIFLKICSKYDR